jgi:L-fucose dehydrogenase
MDLLLKNKVAVVSGGAQGIGAAIVRAFAAEGAVPVVLDRNLESAQALIDEIGVGRALQVELTDEASIAAAAREIGRIDILVNNAGVNDSVSLEAKPGEFMASLEKNLFHVFALTHYSLAELKKNKGAVVNISSKVSLTGQGGTSGYAAAKGGVNALTREWALALAENGVRVNAVLPAEVWTPMYKSWIDSQDDGQAVLKRIEGSIPLGHRFTAPEEIAATVVFLASEKSGHTTGQLIHPDGGYVHLDRAY